MTASSTSGAAQPATLTAANLALSLSINAPTECPARMPVPIAARICLTAFHIFISFDFDRRSLHDIPIAPIVAFIIELSKNDSSRFFSWLILFIFIFD